MTKKIPFDLDRWLKNPELKVFAASGDEVEIHYFKKCFDNVIVVKPIHNNNSWNLFAVKVIAGKVAYFENIELFLEIPLKLKEFDLKEWLDKGKPDCYTRDGYKVEQLTYFESIKEFPLVGASKCWIGGAMIKKAWNRKGYYTYMEGKNNTDLMLVDED